MAVGCHNGAVYRKTPTQRHTHDTNTVGESGQNGKMMIQACVMRRTRSYQSLREISSSTLVLWLSAPRIKTNTRTRSSRRKSRSDCPTHCQAKQPRGGNPTRDTHTPSPHHPMPASENQLQKVLSPQTLTQPVKSAKRASHDFRTACPSLPRHTH